MLCLAYLTEDQRLAGELLLWLGGAYALCTAWRPMFAGVVHAAPATDRAS